MNLELHYNVYGCYRDPMAGVALTRDAVDAGFEGIWIGDHVHVRDFHGIRIPASCIKDDVDRTRQAFASAHLPLESGSRGF